MRARICSAFSCDMFARVVWLKLWGAIKLPIFALPFVARTRHAWLARLTRARRGGSQRGRRESSLLTFAALLVTQKRDKKNPFYDFSQKIPHQQKNTPFPRFGKARHNACLSRDMLKLNLHLTLGTQYRMSGCRPPVIFLLLTRL